MPVIQFHSCSNQRILYKISPTNVIHILGRVVARDAKMSARSALLEFILRNETSPFKM